MPSVPFPKALKAKPTLRQSLLGSFDDCALTTKFEMDYRQGWDSHPQGRGQLTHRTLARCLEEMHRQGEPKIEMDVALAILHEVLRQEGVDDVCHEPGCDKPAKVLPESKRHKNGRSLICPDGHRHHSDVVNVPMREIRDLYWIVSKWARETEFDVANLIDVERRIEVVVNYPNPSGGTVERTLTGQLDALFLDVEDPTHAIVLDWKDTWAIPPQTELSFEGYFQQRFYALLVMRKLKAIDKVTLREFYVRYSEPREATITRDMLDDIEAEVAALAERFDRAFETNVWKPTPGRHCSYCPRPAACPIPVFARGDGRIIDAAHAAKVAAQFTVAEQVLRQSRESLKAYVDKNGPIPVKDSKGTTFLAYEEVSRTKKPSADEAAEAQRMGVSVESLFKTSRGTRFGVIRVKPDSAVAFTHDPEWDDGSIMDKLKESVARVKAAQEQKTRADKG